MKGVATLLSEREKFPQEHQCAQRVKREYHLLGKCACTFGSSHFSKKLLS